MNKGLAFIDTERASTKRALRRETQDEETAASLLRHLRRGPEQWVGISKQVAADATASLMSLSAGGILVPHPAMPCVSPLLTVWRLTPYLSKRSIGTCPCQASIPNSEADCGSLSLM
jgi:hypothetical protein